MTRAPKKGAPRPGDGRWLSVLVRDLAGIAAEGGGEEQILPVLVDRIREHQPCGAALITVSAAADEADRFRIAAASTDIAAIAALTGRSYRRAGSFTERALREGLQQVRADASLEPGTILDALARATPLTHAIIAPFRTSGMGEGGVILLNPEDGERSVGTAEAAAGIAALALGAVGRVGPETLPRDVAAYGEEAAERLARTHRLAALGELAAGVAHDLNNALNPIVSFADLLASEASDPERVRLYASRILLAATDGAETVKRILGLTRRRGATWAAEPVPLASTARDALELSRPTWAERQQGGRIEAVVSIDPDLQVRASAADIREVLLNLINNAVDAMPAGGTLRLIGRREGDIAVLAVQDAGVGMAPDVRDRALEPFYTTKGARGTGLGLSEVASIVRRHGGRVEIESWPGVGTTVALKFRVVVGEAKAEPAAPRGKPAGKPTRILLVDDNVLNAEALAASLRSAGHVVTVAENAELALEQFHRGRFNLVIADVGLPGMSGFELAAELRRVNPKVRIGIVTGWSIDEEAEQINEQNFAFVLMKPVTPQELISLI